jgi:SAM-dependent methyltransferase
MERDHRARYDAFGSWDHDWVAAPEDDLVAKPLFRLIGPVERERILDLGCGQGRIARTRGRRGNDVVGVDVSAELLDIARADETNRISYVHADVCTTQWWDGDPFDGVVSSMALMDIDDLDGAVSTAATTVRLAGGSHGRSSILPSPASARSGRAGRREAATSMRWWNTGGDGVRGRVGSNHRTLSTYLNAMLMHGFALQATDEPRWRPSASDLPMPFFLVTRWRRT